jgi:hypothetical protein
METKNELPNPADFMKLGEDAFIKNVHEKLRETLSPTEKQMWINGYLLALTNFKQFQEQDKKMYSEEEVLEFTQTMIMQYKFGNTNIEQMDLLKETLQLFKNK